MNSFQDLLSFIDFIKNTDTFESRLKALQAENERLEINIKNTGIVGVIQEHLATAQEAEAMAEKKLAAATAQADVIVAKARIEFDKRFSELAEKEAQVNKQKLDAAALLDAAEKRTTLLNEQLERERMAVSENLALLQAERAEVSERLKKLKAVMGG